MPSPRNGHRVPENSCHLLHTYYCYQLCFNASLIVSLDPSTVLIDEIGIVIVVVVTLTLKIKKANTESLNDLFQAPSLCVAEPGFKSRFGWFLLAGSQA